jgi:hypothetical protein
VLHDAEGDDKFDARRLDVQLINSKFQLPIGLRLAKLYELLMPYQSNTVKLTYNKDRHKGIKIEVYDNDLSKVTAFVFHTGCVLLAGDNKTTNAYDWTLPCAMANGFQFVLDLIKAYESQIAMPLPKATQDKLATKGAGRRARAR